VSLRSIHRLAMALGAILVATPLAAQQTDVIRGA
jgi:hypothetical protein